MRVCLVQRRWNFGGLVIGRKMCEMWGCEGLTMKGCSNMRRLSKRLWSQRVWISPTSVVFRQGTHHGIIVVRVPDVLPTWVVNAELISALQQLRGQSLRGALVIVELGRLRVRR